jgi:CelD/BcsL family acetyltransferase involved in cellulose biosynthesis
LVIDHGRPSRGGRSRPGIVEVRSWQDWPLVSDTWAALARESPHSSFFLSLSWVDSWMRVFGEPLEPKVLLFRDGKREVSGMCLFVVRHEPVGPFRLRRAYLNTAGEDEADETCVEYNALLCKAEFEREVVAAFASYAQEQSWDELVFNGMGPGPILTALQDADYAATMVSNNQRSAYFVPLASLGGPAKDSYVDSLSRSTREQIRRSVKIYEARGPIEVRAAVDLRDAHSALNDLAEFHQAAWKARGKDGIFASPRLLSFHRHLIDAAFPQVGVQLLRVTVGGDLLAVLYHFLHAGRVHFYQSGIKYEEDNRLKPGLVAHSRAVEFYRNAGYSEYDFLAGNSRYKQSLSTSHRSVAWLTYRRPSLKVKTIEALRSVRRRFR